MASELFQQVESYPWNEDSDFQNGLNAILGNSASEQREDIALQARCFYYTRKFGVNVDFAGYKGWRSNSQSSGVSSSNTTVADKTANSATRGPSLASAISDSKVVSSTSTPITETDPARPTFTYADIVDMIKNNQTIKGIKDIPDTVLEGQGTQSTKSTRKKPWEKDGQAAAETMSAPSAEHASA